MRKPAIIFDFGNVIATFDFVRATTKLGERLGISGRDALDRLESLGFREILRTYESGQSSAVEFSARITSLMGLSLAHDEFAAIWGDIFTANESIIPLVDELKAEGYPLLLGSNTNDLHAATFRRQFAAILRHFDRLVLSYEVGHVKPSGDFYRACVAAAGLTPAECLFIDDLAENVVGAREAGLVGILYTTTDTLREDLVRLGIAARPRSSQA